MICFVILLFTLASVLWHHWRCSGRSSGSSLWRFDICPFWDLHRRMDLHRVAHHNDWCWYEYAWVLSHVSIYVQYHSKVFCSPRLHLFDQKYSKNCEIFLRCVLYFNILWNVIYACDQSCIFSIITPVFSVTWSSEIIIIYWLAAQEILLIIISVENGCAASYFCLNIFRILFNK